ncbi:MAG TPA: hypothetical protein VHJ20_07835 [Polyangia bacterium]|nr:hypothetical protein [Polyangia bacterium]
MWTRLVAGAAAHDINNFAQGLLNLLSLAGSPNATPDSLAHYAALARDGIKELQALGRDLRAVADAEAAREPQRLDLALTEALADVVPASGRTLERAAATGPMLVAADGAALRLAIRAVVRYALAATAPGGVVRVALEGSSEAARASVVVDAPAAAAPPIPEETDLARLMLGPEPVFASNTGLVLAGVAAESCGGAARVAVGAEGGLRFKLSFDAHAFTGSSSISSCAGCFDAAGGATSTRR